jgi:hypothetical protein
VTVEDDLRQETKQILRAFVIRTMALNLTHLTRIGMYLLWILFLILLGAQGRIQASGHPDMAGAWSI